MLDSFISEEVLFYIAFISQILLISVYFPKKIMSRVERILNDYPIEKYPKLYVKSPDYYRLGNTIYKVFNGVIIAIGVFILVLVTIEQVADEGVTMIFSVVFFFLQMLPIFVLEMSGFSHYKQMRKMNTNPTRKADIKLRGLFDFVSPRLFIFAVVCNVACVLFYIYLEPFYLDVESDSFVIFVTLLLSNLLYAVIIRFNINGKKLDPYQASEDRTRITKNTVRSLVILSIIASLFLMVNEGVQQFELDSLKTLCISGYLQLIAWLSLGGMLKNSELADINFDVYKKDVDDSVMTDSVSQS